MNKGVSSRQKADALKSLYGAEYVERFSEKQRPYRLERLLRYVHLEPDFHVLDLACGDGLLLPLVAAKVAWYAGVDFSELFIEAANARKSQLGIKNAEFYCDEITSFCGAHLEKFHCAFAMDVSEHVYDDDWLKILLSVRRALRPGGKLYLHTPNALFLIEQMKARGILLSQFEEHVAVRSPAENLDLLRRAGFAATKVRLLPHYNSLRHLHPLSYLPILGKWFKARIFIEAAC